ncbi:MAG: MarR family transcriptional regulator [Pseudomonadota bacterium]
MNAEQFELIDHIGWRLWQAAADWKARFVEEMVRAGHGWYAEARSSVIPYIGAEGTKQVDIVREMGLTKQAVQQLVDDLEQEGIVTRQPDPADRRRKIVVFTEKGRRARQDANAVKRKIEAEYRQELGDDNFDRLFNILEQLAPT